MDTFCKFFGIESQILSAKIVATGKDEDGTLPFWLNSGLVFYKQWSEFNDVSILDVMGQRELAKYKFFINSLFFGTFDVLFTIKYERSLEQNSAIFCWLKNLPKTHCQVNKKRVYITESIKLEI